jgi:hydrogenase nickel incorporation protein HypA/HybF
MHELSIAVNLVEMAAQAAESAQAARVEVVRLRLGRLSGVVADALLFGYDIATQNTILAGSRLDIEETDGREIELVSLEIRDAVL